jgi:glycosyltransferase involved in cell wall biosynthesis
MLKGYDGWAGRAIQGLEALLLCQDALQGYEIVVYAASPATVQRVRQLQAASRLNLKVLPRSPHAEVVKLFGRSRVAIGINETDGVPNAMLEAMTMGAFPVQSDTQSTTEWIRNGSNGLLVAKNDPADIAAAIRRALTDDALVNAAAEVNRKLMLERLDISKVKPKVIQIYRDIADTGGGR